MNRPETQCETDCCGDADRHDHGSSSTLDARSLLCDQTVDDTSLFGNGIVSLDTWLAAHGVAS